MNDMTSAICRDDCVARPATRNHFFTGKLLVERDFNDEQRYFREKNRLHLQRLHGEGVVCGLRIKQHPNPSCRNRLVIIEPGSAIDCCGHDILVAEEDVFDFSQVPAVQALAQQGGTHVLQFCISYRECPTEEIPVLYDDCGCDDTQCAPNRVLESFKIDVIVDPPAAGVAELRRPKLNWNATISIAHATAIALDEKNQRLFVLTGDANAATLYQVSTANLAIEQAQSLSVSAYDVAVSPDGNTVYVAAAGKTDGQLFVFDTSSSTGLSSSFQNVTVTGSGTSALALSRTPDEHILAVALAINSGNNLWFWPQGTTAAPVTGAIAANLTRAAIASNGNTAYVGQPKSANLYQIDLTSATLQSKTLALGGIQSTDVVALAASTAADKLAILDGSSATAANLYLIDPTTPGTAMGPVALAYKTPAGLAVPTGGQWALATVSDGATTYVQAVNLGAIAQNIPTSATAPLSIGAGGQVPLVTSSGDRLFVPFTGNLSTPGSGGVAVIEMTDLDCQDMLTASHCPHCDTPDCLVLATVANYQAQFALVDMPDPPPSGGPNPNEAWIDNNTGRIVLPSTRAIADALECMMQSLGSSGLQQGPASSAQQLTHIVKIYWKSGNATYNNGTTIPAKDFTSAELTIEFDSKGVTAANVNNQTVILLVPHLTDKAAAPFQVFAQKMTFAPASAQFCSKVTITFDMASVPELIKDWPTQGQPAPPPPIVRLLVLGDLIPDANGYALDANNLPACWSGGQPSGDGVAGGTYESAFELKL